MRKIEGRGFEKKMVGIRELNPEDEYLGRRWSEQRLTDESDSDEMLR
jgi:hypothetical protein